MDELIHNNIKVDTIITDPPYGTTQCKWDSVIPFTPMWEDINKLTKNNGAICIFGSEPFSSILRCSNIKHYKYDWIWEKTKPQGFLNAKKMPLKGYEQISIFYNKPCTYNPQGLIKINKILKNTGTKNATSLKKTNGDKTSANNAIKNITYKQEYTNYPTMILKYSNSGNKQVHPTQKPVDLLEYLIRTYTNENEIVLDFTMGSGSTGVACMNTNRRFIGIELDATYCDIAKNRIQDDDMNIA
jgi:site-specific DNA-methyltransferase (adenine-specific)